MRFRSVVIALCAFNVMFYGCVATTDDVRGIYARQTRLEARVERIYQDVESLKKQSKEMGSNEQQIAQIQENLANLQQSYSELSTRVDNLERRTVSSVPPAPQPGGVTGGEQGSPQPEPRMFNDGYQKLTEGDYKGARDRFKLFLSSYPNSAQADDAQYWIAESYYREGKFEEAILEFQRFIDTYPRDERVPLSYLKQGLSLINIGRNEEAKLFLQTLIDKYPKSDEARIAREKLRELAVRR
ncbi:MAG TPA: tol-pal system protein YbgF [Thermodesulfobacteriota bacterium]|nr:tol-pal system protein YbgF [Thermodesulfobacteriota bacterium]